MKKTLWRSLILIIIIGLSLGIGLLYNYICDTIDKMVHPLKYTEYVEQYAAAYEIPVEIVYAVIKTESSFRADAVSHKGAVGLMQLTPDTFEWLMTKTGEKLDISVLSDPKINIKYGTFFLRMLYDEFMSWDLVYAAYNSGLSRVRGWLADESISENGALVNIPYKETAAFVIKVGEAAKMYKRLYF